LSSDIVVSCFSTALSRHRRIALLLRPCYCVALASVNYLQLLRACGSRSIELTFK
jgi:hypothetical protein